MVFYPTLWKGSALISQSRMYDRAQLNGCKLCFGTSTHQQSDFVPKVHFLCCYLLLMWFLGDPNENVQEVVCDVADSFKSGSCLLG